MIDRYTTPEMKKIWDQERRFAIWLELEIAVCEAWAKLGKIPEEALNDIKSNSAFSLPDIIQKELVNKHEVIAFLDSVVSNVGESGRYIHLGLTSSDIMDTGLAVMLKESADLLMSRLIDLENIIIGKAKQYKGVPMIGRTHGVHAEPISFGLKMLVWLAEIQRHIIRLKEVRSRIAVGKISGAVGTYAHLDPFIEEYVCEKIGLGVEPVSTQIVQRDRHSEYLSLLALIGSSIDKFALEIRMLQRTEVLEASEPFTEGQKGSSAMPHKMNPVLCERLCGLARVLRGNAVVGFENIPLWHERDISHSGAERIVLADSSILLDYMLMTFKDIIKNLQIYPDKMLHNLELTGGLIYSQRLLLALIEKGMSRENAYELVQTKAMESWKNGKNFRKEVALLPEVKKYFSEAEIEKLFKPETYLEKEDIIYRRFELN